MHDPFRERDLDARFVERDLDPLAEFAGDRPLTKRLGIAEHFDNDRRLGELIDTLELYGLDDVALPRVVRGKPRSGRIDGMYNLLQVGIV